MKKYNVIWQHTDDLKNNPGRSGIVNEKPMSKTAAKRMVAEYKKDWQNSGLYVQKFVGSGYAAGMDRWNLWIVIILNCQ